MSRSRRGIPLIAFLSFEFSRARRPASRQRRAEVHRVVRAAHLRTLRAGARAQPLHVRIPAQHRRDDTPRSSRSVSTSKPSLPSARSRDLRAELELPRGHAAAGVRRPLLRREEHSRAHRGVSRARRALSPAADRRRANPAAPAMSRACPIAATTARSPATSPRPTPSCMPARTKPSAWWSSKRMACGRPVVAMRAGARAGAGRRTRRDARRTARRTRPSPPRISPRPSPRSTSATSTRSAPRRARHVVANYSWSRALQALMARYQVAVSARRAAGRGEALARAETPRTNWSSFRPAGPLLQVVLRPLHVFDARADAHLVDEVREVALQRLARRRSASRTSR